MGEIIGVGLDFACTAVQESHDRSPSLKNTAGHLWVSTPTTNACQHAPVGGEVTPVVFTGDCHEVRARGTAVALVNADPARFQSVSMAFCNTNISSETC